jgi:hypothetical protein
MFWPYEQRDWHDRGDWKVILVILAWDRKGLRLAWSAGQLKRD